MNCPRKSRHLGRSLRSANCFCSQMIGQIRHGESPQDPKSSNENEIECFEVLTAGLKCMKSVSSPPIGPTICVLRDVAMSLLPTHLLTAHPDRAVTLQHMTEQFLTNDIPHDEARSVIQIRSSKENTIRSKSAKRRRSVSPQETAAECHRGPLRH
jgi:hypothetical protein